MLDALSDVEKVAAGRTPLGNFGLLLQPRDGEIELRLQQALEIAALLNLRPLRHSGTLPPRPLIRTRPVIPSTSPGAREFRRPIPDSYGASTGTIATRTVDLRE